VAQNRVEYRFVLDGYTPDTIPQARLAEYLADLALLYGNEKAVHFLKLEESSLAVVSVVELDSDEDVSDRVQIADSDAAPAEVRRVYQALRRRVIEDGGPAYIARGPARVLEFSLEQAVNEPLIYGPFWQQGHLSGTVILLGGKSDPVSVKLQDANGEVHTCKARREIAKRLRDHLFEQPVRVIGRGKWVREATGRWRLEQFDIDNFVPLEDESLSATIARLQAIDARWKDRPDPLAELEVIRRGE
jgi:hypothetical protein